MSVKHTLTIMAAVAFSFAILRGVHAWTAASNDFSNVVATSTAREYIGLHSGATPIFTGINVTNVTSTIISISSTSTFSGINNNRLVRTNADSILVGANLADFLFGKAGQITVTNNSTGSATLEFSSLNISQWTNDSNYLVNTRTINTSAPLSGGGNLTADRTFSLSLEAVTLVNVGGNLAVRLNSSSTQTCVGSNKVSAITSDGIVTCTTDETGGGGGGVGTSTLGSYAPGNLSFFVSSSTISATSSLQIVSSTGLLQNFGLTSSTQIRSPSSTIEILTIQGSTASRLLQTSSVNALQSVANLTNWIAGTTNEITVTDDGDGTVTLSLPSIVDLGASSEFRVSSSTIATLKITNVSSTNIAVTGVTSCTEALETDATGRILCGTDATGGAGATIPSKIHFWIGSALTWTNQPAANTELLANATNIYRQRVDLSNATQARVTVGINTAGSSTSTLGIQYSTSTATGHVNTACGNWHWLDGTTGCLSAGQPKTAISATGYSSSTYSTIATPARGEVLLRAVGASGNGVADPVFENLILEVK